jgi:hypothetical protein
MPTEEEHWLGVPTTSKYNSNVNHTTTSKYHSNVNDTTDEWKGLRERTLSWSERLK